jgi:hypothetical protein
MRCRIILLSSRSGSGTKFVVFPVASALAATLASHLLQKEVNYRAKAIMMYIDVNVNKQRKDFLQFVAFLKIHACLTVLFGAGAVEARARWSADLTPCVYGQHAQLAEAENLTSLSILTACFSRILQIRGIGFTGRAPSL